METSDLKSSDFWQSNQCRVMVNPRDAKALAESEIIDPWLKAQPSLSGHLLFATSGSTGGSKWVALSRKALLASARIVNEFLSVTGDDRWLLALPTFHVGGIGILARSYFAGCDVVSLDGKWNPEDYHRTAISENITLSSLVPTQLIDLLELGLPAPPTLRAVLIGGGRLDDASYQKAIQLDWPVMETYGMTETCSQVATAELGRRDLMILPGWEAKASEIGQLSLKGEPLLTTYVSCKQGGCQMLDPKSDCWFTTGDRVELCSQSLIVKGRVDRCVKVLGELVDLTIVENRLVEVALKLSIRHGDLVVIPVPDVRQGSRLILCSDHDVDAETLIAQHNEICIPVERLDSFCLLGSIPRSSLGKILYAELGKIVERV